MQWKVLWSLTLLLGTWTLHARRLTLDFLCTSEVRGHMYVRDVPWDCTAYVICMNGRAIHTTCPQGYKYHAGQGYNRCVPITSNVSSCSCHGVIWNYIRTICHYNPAATVPDAVKCSQYLDCSVHGTGHEYVDYLLECPYPTLYSTQTGACEHYLSVMCGERMEPKAPCDYSQFQQLYNCTGPSCPACHTHHPSCVGLTNGRHALPSNPNVTMECNAERTMNLMSNETSFRMAFTSK